MNSTSLRVTTGTVALLSLVLLAGCQKEQQAAAPQNLPPPQVGVVTLEAQPFTLSTELPGRTAAWRVAEVRPQVNGIVQKRLFVEGGDVKAGQPLYQIDAATYDAAVKSAEATLASAKALAARYRVLVDEKAISRQQYDEAEAARQRAEAALEQARINLRYTQVMAPIAGRIGRSSVSEGALVRDGQSDALATIQQLDPMYVDVVQPAAEMLRLRREVESGQLKAVGGNGIAVSLTLPDGSPYAQTGRLEFSEAAVDAGTGTVTLRATFPNPQRLLLPGMFVQARLETGRVEQTILAPQQGVTRNPKGQAVAMVVGEGNKVEPRILEVEPTPSSFWRVRSGLKAGDKLITEGLQFIQPGVEVNPKPATNVPALRPAAAPAADGKAAR